MEMITNIVFSPQDMDDTNEAIEIADEIIKKGQTVTLEPSVNLISTSCLARLSAYGFRFSSIQNKFVK